MRNINYLLKKYETRVPGEVRGSEYEVHKKQRQRLREKHELVEEIGRLMFLRPRELESVHYLVDKFKDFNKLHRSANKRTIITAFCFIFVRIRNPRARVWDYKACSLNGLNERLFNTVQTRVIVGLLRGMPVVPYDGGGRDNNVLCRLSMDQARLG